MVYYYSIKSQKPFYPASKFDSELEIPFLETDFLADNDMALFLIAMSNSMFQLVSSVYIIPMYKG